ncbi:MAG: right-handed parallel beta-helix repeat-containing protein [Sterolibacteriaceae bacterium MAG5]|nr:right-handed parallel beta-helix repeat-containing protein [Candidatus Nitricoxidireducens bremensis]
MNGSPISLIAAVLLALTSLPGFAATRYAGGCGAPSSATITAAIAAAAAGDTILVCSGTWNEAVTVNKDNLTIRSATGNRTDVTVSNSNTVFTITASATVLKDMTVTSSGSRGIHRQWTGSPSAHTFENLAITAKNDGIYVEVSGKLTFTNLTVASSEEDGIRLGWDTVAEHVFDTVTVTAKKSGIYIGSYGGATYSNVEVSTEEDYAIYMAPNYDTTFTTVVASSEKGDGIYLAWSPGDKNFTFTDVTVTADDKGIHVERSAKVAMTDVNATSSDSAAIYLSSSSVGAHTFSNIAATGRSYGLYTYNGGTTFSDIAATATNGDAIYLRPSSATTFTDVTATATGGYGIYMGWASGTYALNLSGLNVTSTDKGLYIDRSAAVTLQNSSLYSSGSDAVYLGYSASGAHVLNNLALDASGSGILFESAVSSSTISNICVGSGQYGVRITQYDARNVAITGSKFTTTSHGVSTSANPSYKTVVSGSCFMKSSTPRAYSNSTTHTFNGNFWQGVAGGTSYSDGNVRDNGTLASCPVTSCYAATVTPPVADYRFDECSWTSGTAGAVADSSGNGYNGTPYSVTTAANGVVQRAADLSANSASDYLQWPIGILNGRTNFTVALWFKTSVSKAQQEILHGLGSSTTDDEIEIYLINSNKIRVNLRNKGNDYSASTSFTDGAWHHLAVSRFGKKVCVYLDATSLGCNNRSSNALSITNANALVTGQKQTSYGGGFASAQGFQGQIEEFKVFANALSIGQIGNLRTNEAAGKNWDGTTRGTTCSSGLDHIRIEHSGSGVTCLREALTIKACQTADCSTQYTASVALNLSPSGGWYAAATGGTSSDALTFTGNATRYFEKTAIGTVTLSASSVSPAATNGVKCYVGDTQNCSLVFSDAGFVIAANKDEAETTVPTQTAGTASGDYYLRAVKTDKKTKVCEAALVGPDPVKVNFAYECLNPATCYTSNLMKVNGGTDTTIARNAAGSVTNYTEVDMTFDNNGNAPFRFNYSDVGQIRLHMKKAAGGGLLGPISGSSNAFVTKPAGFTLAATCTADSVANAVSQSSPGASGPKFCRAGRAFSAAATAVTSGGATTPNYGRESTPETISVAWERYAPTGTETNPGSPPDVAFAYTGDSSNFTGTYAATGLSWNEVGILSATVAVGKDAYEDDKYLGTDSVSSTRYVGRFYPDHFNTTSTGQCGGFAYSGRPETTVVTGQPFTVVATAKNAAGNTTVNYVGGYAKPVNLSVTTGTTAGTLYVDTDAGGNGAIPATKFAKGVGTAAHTDATGKLSFVFSTYPTVSTPIVLHAEDADTVSSTADTFTDIGIDIRAGRLWLGNAFGSDQRSLTIPYELQYWNGNAFVKNTGDTCTTIARANIGLFNYLGGVSETNVTVANNLPASIANTGGGGTITLTPPTTGGNLANVAGSVDLVVNLGATTTPAIATTWTDLNAANRDPNDGPTGAERPWLRSRWYGTAWDRDPTARATFGVFGSSQRRGPIYIRESY